MVDSRIKKKDGRNSYKRRSGRGSTNELPKKIA